MIVVDTSEQFCTEAGASMDELFKYKNYTLPVVAHFDDLGKLLLVSLTRKWTPLSILFILVKDKLQY